VRRIPKPILWAAGLVLGVWVLWRLTYPAFDWHQKLMLVVETPSGKVTGYSVSSMRVTMGPGLFMDSPSIGVAFVGEAAFVEVAPGRYLFALVSNGPGWASDTFAPVAVERNFTSRLRLIEASRGDPAKDIPRERWPMLVTFDDISKPETVREVDPKDLAEVFGEGVRLQAVTLEITEKAVTDGVLDALLPWLGRYPEAALLPKIDPNDWSLRATLRHGDFIRRP
jgi:hypothetical protein